MKLVLLRSKYVTAKCTETLSPPPSIQFSLSRSTFIASRYKYILNNECIIGEEDEKVFSVPGSDTTDLRISLSSFGDFILYNLINI